MYVYNARYVLLNVSCDFEGIDGGTAAVAGKWKNNLKGSKK